MGRHEGEEDGFVSVGLRAKASLNVVVHVASAEITDTVGADCGMSHSIHAAFRKGW